MSLSEVWDQAASSPFYPLVPKERQFLVGFTLLLIGQYVLTLEASMDLTVPSVCIDWIVRT